MPRKQLIVGLHGLAYNGKSTVGDLIANELDLVQHAIAKPITQACAELLQMPHHDFLQLPKEEELPGMRFTKRQIMQAIGAAVRANDEDALLKILDQRIASRHQMHDHLFGGYLITDIRLPAEAEWLRNQGGTLIHIIRHDAPTTHPDITEQPLIAEAGDVVINNNSTIEELQTKIRHVTRDLINDLQNAA